jgi:hypothetical protein
MYSNIMASFNQKLSISAGSAFLFALVNLPMTYKFTSGLTGLGLYNAATKCPTSLGLIVHALVFFAISYFSMGNAASKGIKIKHSLYGTLIFFLLSNPATFKLVNNILGGGVADSAGCPSLFGIVLHALVYCAVLVAVMYLPSGNK